MATRQSVFDVIGRLFFNRSQIRSFGDSISTAGLNVSTEAFAGYLVIIVLLVSLLVSVLIVNNEFIYSKLLSIFNSIIQIPDILSWFLVYILSLILSYGFVFIFVTSFLSLKAESRRREVEVALPDFLLLVSANIKAGMALDRAMWYAAKPDYGILSNEVRVIIKGSFSGTSMEQSLTVLSSRFDSRAFSRTISLIKQSSSSGGEVSEVLERTADDVRNSQIIKKEVSASLIMYQIFLFFSSVLGAPFLFAVGNKLVQIFESQRFAVSAAPSVAPGFGTLPTFDGLIVTSEEFFYFTLATIFITALFSSFIVGVIKTGSKNQGIKYLPFLLIGGYFVFWIVDSFLAAFFLSFS